MLYKTLESYKKKAYDGDNSMNLAEALLEYIARDSVMTYDYGVNFSKLGKSLKNVTEKLSFQEVLAQAGKHLSLCGGNVALVMELVNNEPFIDWGTVGNYTKVGDELEEITIDTKRTVEIGGQSYPLYHLFKKNEHGAVEKVEGYWDKKEFVALQKVSVVLPFNKIPAFILKNNSLGEADVPEEIMPLLAQLAWLGDDFLPEWMASSTQWINNKAFGSTQEAEDYMDAMIKHEKIHDADDPDNKIGPSIAPVSMGGASIVNLTGMINYLEDKVFKYSMQFREVGIGGTNKHNLEIASQNKQAFEYMLMKLDWRQRQLSAAFTLFQELMSGITDENAVKITVTIEVPELEKFKVDNMKAEVALLEAQVENQLGQAKSWEASAEMTEKTDPNAKQPMPNQNQNGGE